MEDQILEKIAESLPSKAGDRTLIHLKGKEWYFHHSLAPRVIEQLKKENCIILGFDGAEISDKPVMRSDLIYDLSEMDRLEDKRQAIEESAQYSLKVFEEETFDDAIYFTFVPSLVSF